MAQRIIAFGVAPTLAIALTLVLGGCSVLPHSTSSGGGNSAGSGSGSGAGNSQKATLPATFPKADVPLVGDDFAYALAVSDKSWAVYVRVGEAKTGFAKASDLLIGAGFEKSTDIGGDTESGSVGLFTSEKYTIELTSAKDSDFGPVVNYTISKKA
jgi:hypothetical protein